MCYMPTVETVSGILACFLEKTHFFHTPPSGAKHVNLSAPHNIWRPIYVFNTTP